MAFRRPLWRHRSFIVMVVLCFAYIKLTIIDKQTKVEPSLDFESLKRAIVMLDQDRLHELEAMAKNRNEFTTTTQAVAVVPKEKTNSRHKSKKNKFIFENVTERSVASDAVFIYEKTDEEERITTTPDIPMEIKDLTTTKEIQITDKLMVLELKQDLGGVPEVAKDSEPETGSLVESPSPSPGPTPSPSTEYLDSKDSKIPISSNSDTSNEKTTKLNMGWSTEKSTETKVTKTIYPNVTKTHLNATKANYYIFYKPEQYDRRHIFRKYTNMWREINPPDMVPFDYWLVTATTTETIKEDAEYKDMLLFEGFDEKYMGTIYETYEYQWRMLLGTLNHAWIVDHAPNHVVLTAWGTTLINYQMIRSAFELLSGDDPSLNTNQLLVFDNEPYHDTHNYTSAALQMAIRADLVEPWLRRLVRIDFDSYENPRDKFFAISGVGRPQELHPIGLVEDLSALQTLPYELENFSKEYNISDVETWAMEMVPSGNMSHDLPARYHSSRNDDWVVDFVTTPPCSQDITKLLLVKSARHDWSNRQIIRKYYEIHTKLPFPDYSVNNTLRFVIGLGEENEPEIVQKNITDEISRFDDIIIGNFTDQYDNLPLKSLTGHQYANEVCPYREDRFVVFHDDDTLPKLAALDKFIAKKESVDDVNCFAHLGVNTRPMRWNKYNVTYEQWEDRHYFPVFCGGPCTGFTQNGTLKILNAAKKTDSKGLKLEDVLFTGIIRQRANIPTPGSPRGVCLHIPDNVQGLAKHMSGFLFTYPDKDLMADITEVYQLVGLKYKPAEKILAELRLTTSAPNESKQSDGQGTDKVSMEENYTKKPKVDDLAYPTDKPASNLQHESTKSDSA